MAGRYGGINDALEEMRKHQAEILRSAMPDFSSPIRDFLASHEGAIESAINTQALKKNLAQSFSPLTEEWAKSITGSLTSQMPDLTGISANWKSLFPWEKFAALAETIAETSTFDIDWDEAKKELPEVTSAVDSAVDSLSESRAVGVISPETDYSLRIAGFIVLLMSMALALLVLGQYLPPDAAQALESLLAAYGLIALPKRGTQD